ncbi:hypothetical protein QUF79_15625 [Fictibacillus enclensis]|uniref:hypothetical protein n=1 Tax=Fictibacillus enclensis TaxID=1017270 RepID=UPI00259FF614|nr:hypothetical protein [Fictibacillus enclensis]MDM5199447.1 hypothetical protein [Fictibacillus enclensis]
MESKNGDKFTNNEEQAVMYEEIIALGVLIKSIGQVIETVGVTNLFLINEDPSPGDKKVITAVWLDTIGIFLQTIGVFEQVYGNNTKSILQAQGIEITGVTIQSFALALEAAGGIQILQEEQLTEVMDFIP